MKKAWKLVGTVILTVFFLGVICLGVGLLTGADLERVYGVLDSNYQIESTMNLYEQSFTQFQQRVQDYVQLR